MKKILKTISYLSLLFVTLFSVTSCEDDNMLTVDNQSKPVAIAFDINTITLDGTNQGNPALTLTWTEATYSQPVEVNYAVEFSITSNFANPSLAGAIKSANSITWATGELNAAVAKAGVNPFTWTTVYARVKSTLGTQNGSPAISNVVSFSVYSYYNYDFIDLFMVGPACYSGWNNSNNNPPLFRSASNSNEFSYTGFFNADVVKLIEVRGQWAPQYGSSGAGILAPRPTESVPDPSPISGFTAPGYYTFKVNLSTKTYSITPYTVSTTAATSVKISGTAVASTSLNTLGGAFDPHIWYINDVLLVPGNVKFLLNDTNSWGSDTSFSGKAILNGVDIPVIVEDHYEVWFNDLTGEYIMIPKNL